MLTVEENYTANRSIPPHGAAFRGHPMTLHVTCDNPKTDFSLSVSVATALPVYRWHC